ncbi:MAG TPA: uroporphyrinogen decarboxylase family protein [Clostridia bacterium]|nr:uroporphyrinogen decarboxylase family protein [Clostridia bacterium]
MTDRELLNEPLNHRESGRLSIDFGATAVSGIHVLCIERLREFYGLEKKPVKVIEPYQMLGLIEDDLKDALGVTVQGFTGLYSMFGFRFEDWKGYRTLWGQEVLVPGDFVTTPDSDGGELIYPKGDKDVNPSGKMPRSGYFFDSIIRQSEIDEDQLNPEDNMEEFGLIADDDLKSIQEQVLELAQGDRGLIASFGGTGLGDIALVPAPMLRNPRGIRDITEWYISTVTRPDYVHYIFQRQTEIAIENLKKLYAAVGDSVQAAFICGTDFGTQNSQFCSSEAFDDLYLPYYQKINGWIHDNTSWKTFKHSCGAVEPLLDNIIRAGFDIINPVQCSATGMDPEHLKRTYGKDLVFWGGGVDTQKTLPFGTPDEVRDEVRSRCEIFSKDGGFVFNAIHNVQADTPVENVAAMIEVIKEFS